MPKLAAEGLGRFMTLLDRMRAADATEGPAAAIDAVLADGRFMRELLDKATDEEEELYRTESVEQLRAVAADHRTIPDLLEMVSLLTLADDIDDDGSRVLLMTIHAAKGLEFRTVFVVGMEEGIFPDRRCLEGDQLEEERRLAYVAITRAQHGLYLSHARRRRTLHQVTENERSRFLDEIPEDLIDGLDEPMAPAAEGAPDRFAMLKADLGL
jgi:DNA helicase-2/ATP-dependent DNA helicase PcrA